MARASLDGMGRQHILIAGLGSIGRRHLANLRTLGWTRIRLYRTGHSTLPDADLVDAPVDVDLDAAVARRPLAVIVSNPSALHVPVALAAAHAGAHLLIEKPLSHDRRGLFDLQSAVGAAQLVALMGFQFRFAPGLRRLKSWIDEGALGRVVSAQAHWGEYLPDMHPWEDHRISYASRPDLGGGVLLTLCHPFDYLRWLLGEVEQVSAVESRTAGLGLPVDTCVEVALRFASGATGHVHLDFVQRPPEHRLTVIGTLGTATWNGIDHTARRYCVRSERCETVAPPDGFERNHMFLEEMQHFLACVQGTATPVCTLGDGIAALEIALKARESCSGAAQAVAGR